MANRANNSSRGSSSSSVSVVSLLSSHAWLLFLVALSGLTAWKLSAGPYKLQFDGPLEVGSCVQSRTHSLCLAKDASLALYKGLYDAPPPAEATEPVLSLMGGQKKGKYTVDVADGRLSLVLSKKGFGESKALDSVSLLDYPTLLHMI